MGYCLDPSVDDLIFISTSYLKLQEFEKCYYYLKSYESILSTAPYACLHYVYAMFKLNKYEECLKFLNPIESIVHTKNISPELKSAYYYYLGIIMLKFQNKTKALEYLHKSYTADEYNLQAYYYISEIEFELKYTSIIIRSNVNIKEKDLNYPLTKPYKYRLRTEENNDSPIHENSSHQNSDNKNYSSPYACSKFKSIINTLKPEEGNKHSNSDSKNSSTKKISKIQLKYHSDYNYKTENSITKPNNSKLTSNDSPTIYNFSKLVQNYSNQYSIIQDNNYNDILKLYRSTYDNIRIKNYESIYYNLQSHFNSNSKQSKKNFNLELFKYYLESMYHLKKSDELLKYINQYFKLGYIQPEYFSIYSNLLYKISDVNLQYELITLVKQITQYSESYFICVSNYLSQVGDRALCIECLTSALKFYPGSIQLQENLGVEFMLNSQWDRAIKSFTAILREELYSKKSLLLLSDCHLAKHEVSKAIEYLNLAKVVYPMEALVFVKLAHVYLNLNHHENVKKYLDKVQATVNACKGNVLVLQLSNAHLFLCFKLHYQLGHWEQCLVYLRELHQSQQGQVALDGQKAQFYKAVVEYRRGFDEEALKILYQIDNEDANLRKMIAYAINTIVAKEELQDSEVF